MKLKLLIVACFTAVALLSLSGRALTGPTVYGAESPQTQKLPGDDLIIPSVDEKWGEVKFTHQQHLAFSDCTYCHHTNKGLTLESFNEGKSEKIPFCYDCHVRREGDPMTPKSADGTELWSKEAYHINCIDCHKGEITKVPKDAGKVLKQGEGPTKCAACHEVN
ncbi:MAG: cytochrome c family protein [Acidobacteria bacterium]|nr:cytochrome c family protein [Acidobacteriota bacterium]